MLTKEQKESRREGIGASETPALLGLDSYKRPIDIYERIVEGKTDDGDTLHTDRGNFLEPGLRAWASKMLGVTFEPCKTLAHPEHKRVLASPDGVWLEGGKVQEVLELKSPGPRTYHEWGDGGDEAPLRYVAQISQQIAVTGARRGRIVALVDGELKVYTIERDRDFEGDIINAVNTFWSKHVETKTPPPIDGSPSMRDWLARRYPRATKDWVQPDARTVAIMQQLAEAKACKEAAEKELELLQQEIKQVIGGAYGIDIPGVARVTWGETKGRTSIDWEAYARSLGANEDGAREFTKHGAPYRTFRLTTKEAK